MHQSTSRPNFRGLAPFAFLLLAVVAIAAAALRSWHTQRAHDAMLERVQADYAEFATWTYARLLEESLRSSARDYLGPVDHGPGVHMAPPIPSAAGMLHHASPSPDPSCDCRVPKFGPVPDNMLGFTLGSDTVGVALNDSSFLANWVPQANARRSGLTQLTRHSGPFAALRDSLTAQIRDRHQGTGQMLVHDGPQVTLIAFQLMPTAWGDTVVYAVTYGNASLARSMESLLETEDLLPPSLTAQYRTRDVLKLEVADQGDRMLFLSDSSRIDAANATRVSLPAEFAGLTVRTEVYPALAEALVIGGSPRSQLPLLLTLLGMAIALSLVAAGQLRREQQLSRSRADFVAGVSHELRTPLAQIRLFLDTLRLKRAETAESQEWALEQIDRETRRLGQMIDNVLVFARGPSRLLETRPEPVDLDAEVREIVREVEPLARARRSEIVIDVEPDARALVTRAGFRHILLNLLDNATKYGGQSQTIRVIGKRLREQVEISVADQGEGVRPADRRRIFDAFVRGDDAASRASGGSGVGLSLVRDLAEGMGGEVGVDDAPGGGARFTVRLPAA